MIAIAGERFERRLGEEIGVFRVEVAKEFAAVRVDLARGTGRDTSKPHQIVFSPSSRGRRRRFVDSSLHKVPVKPGCHLRGVKLSASGQ